MLVLVIQSNGFKNMHLASIRSVEMLCHCIQLMSMERLIAHAWNEPGKASANVNKKMKMFISTFGTSLPAAPWKRLRKICNDAG